MQLVYCWRNHAAKMFVWLPEDVAEASWHVYCTYVCAASGQPAAARTGRPTPQTADVYLALLPLQLSVQGRPGTKAATCKQSTRH